MCSRSWEDTLEAGSTAGNCNAAWIFQQTPLAVAILGGKYEQTFADMDQQCASPREYPRCNSANSWIVYK